MKTTIVLLACFTFIASVHAQASKKSKDFTIYQEDNQTPSLTLQLPAESQISKEFNFATYVLSKSSLSVFYELDDEPEQTANDPKMNHSIDLLKYAHHLSNKEIGGGDAVVLHKKIAAKPLDINGLKTVLIEYDYVKKVAGQDDEKGKSFLYLIPAKGESALNEKEHPIIIRLTFDFDLPAGANPDYSIQQEIIKTLKPAGVK